MAKTRDIPISEADLAEYLATQDDFALELSVYHEARKLGFTATHGGTYEDPVTQKSRQYDVRAFTLGNNCRVDLAIECKSLKPSYPLLLLQIPRSPEESFHDLICSYERKGPIGLTGEFVSAKTITLRGAESIYLPGDHVAKATAQVGRNERGDLVSGDSEVYEKWSQALASSHDLIMSAAYHHETHNAERFLTFVLPLLVVPDGTLWAADYGEDGGLLAGPHPVEGALLFVGREYTDRFHPVTTVSHLHICTRASASKLLHELARDTNLLDSIFPSGPIRKALHHA